MGGEEIRDIQQQLGITAMYVTHDQEEALAISDRIAVMNGGVIQQIGAPWDVYKNPVNRFVAAFVGQMNFIDAGSPDLGDELATAAARWYPDGIADGTELAVRPEEIEVTVVGGSDGIDRGTDTQTGKPVGSGMVSVPALVRKSVFIGSTLFHVVVPVEGTEWLVERHRPGKEDILPAGTPVRLSFRERALFCFSATGERVV